MHKSFGAITYPIEKVIATQIFTPFRHQIMLKTPQGYYAFSKALRHSPIKHLTKFFSILA